MSHRLQQIYSVCIKFLNFKRLLLKYKLQFDNPKKYIAKLIVLYDIEIMREVVTKLRHVVA